jgi:hypothetical protein
MHLHHAHLESLYVHAFTPCKPRQLLHMHLSVREGESMCVCARAYIYIMYTSTTTATTAHAPVGARRRVPCNCIQPPAALRLFETTVRKPSG